MKVDLHEFYEMQNKSEYFFRLFQHLADINKWGMDVIKVAEFSNNRALTCVTYTILQVTHTTWILLKKNLRGRWMPHLSRYTHSVTASINPFVCIVFAIRCSTYFGFF